MFPTEGGKAEQRYGLGRYTPEATMAVYCELLDTCGGLLEEHGESDNSRCFVDRCSRRTAARHWR